MKVIIWMQNFISLPWLVILWKVIQIKNYNPVVIVADYSKSFCKLRELLFACCLFCMTNQSQNYAMCLPRLSINGHVS